MEDAFCTGCGEKISAEMKFCPKCGTERLAAAVSSAMESLVTANRFPVVYKSEPVKDPSVSDKNRVIALILCWFLGFFGAHRFYVGKTASGVWRVVLGVVSFVLIFIASFNIGFYAEYDSYPDSTAVLLLCTILFCLTYAIWCLIDFVLIIAGKFKDTQGRYVSDWNA